MTDQDKINRAIAEALTAQGFAEELAWGKGIQCGCAAHKVTYLDGEECTFCGHIAVWKPHDFTDPRYLLAALEEYAKRFVIFRIDTYRARHDGIWNGFLGVDYGNSDGDGKGRETYPARGASYCESLRNAFAAALGAAAE